MKKLIILLLFPLISEAQTLTVEENIANIGYNARMHKAGIIVAYSGVFIEMGFWAADIHTWQTHTVAAGFSTIGVIMVLTNWQSYNEYQKLKLEPTKNGIGLVYRF